MLVKDRFTNSFNYSATDTGLDHCISNLCCLLANQILMGKLECVQLYLLAARNGIGTQRPSSSSCLAGLDVFHHET